MLPELSFLSYRKERERGFISSDITLSFYWRKMYRYNQPLTNTHVSRSHQVSQTFHFILITLCSQQHNSNLYCHPDLRTSLHSYESNSIFPAQQCPPDFSYLSLAPGIRSTGSACMSPQDYPAWQYLITSRILKALQHPHIWAQQSAAGCLISYIHETNMGCDSFLEGSQCERY